MENNKIYVYMIDVEKNMGDLNQFNRKYLFINFFWN